ncbi:uncharacterized protein LOC126404422 [Epinephelus moara]|uniref:uncharacterized protein LOC126404422 n=1 Tax=Epinephelus moara TaxID=300413 RepID=UPI00214ED0E4|nr:uncharacterized protein LOC126404422 [Epinephelus moara]
MKRSLKLEEAPAAVLQSLEEVPEEKMFSEEEMFSVEVVVPEEEMVPEEEEDVPSSEDESLEGSGEEFLPGKEEPCSSSEEEGVDWEEVEEDDGTSPWRSRNGDILWSPSHEEAQHFLPPPILTPGPTHFALARIPDTAFELFFPKDTQQQILHFTNLQGRRFICSSLFSIGLLRMSASPLDCPCSLHKGQTMDLQGHRTEAAHNG